METPTSSTEFLASELELDIAKAVHAIREHQNASAAFLQRHLKLSYGRAAQILEHLEKLGVVGPAKGRNPRSINLEALNRFEFSSALPSAEKHEEAMRVTPVADGNVSQGNNQPEMPSADEALKSGWRNGDAALQERSETSPTAETKRVAPDAIAAVEKGSQSIEGSSPSPLTNLPACENCGEPVPTKDVRWCFDCLPKFVPQSPAAATALPEIRLAVVAYLPPVRFNTLAFLENLKRNPPAHPLITFSDDPSFEPTVKMKRSIEIPSLMEKQHGVSNLAFYLAFGECWKRGFTHFIYAEADCRFKSNPEKHLGCSWDYVLFIDFAFAQSNAPVPLILGGSMVLDAPFSSDPETAKRAKELLAKWNPNLNSPDPKERNKPIVCRAQRGARNQGSMVGCNGAGAIYSVEGLRTLFPEITEPGDNAAKVKLAHECMGYDFEIAKRLWQMRKAAAFDYVAYLPSMFSSFGDSVSSEEERLAMLRDGRCVLIHPVKSEVVE